MLRVTATGLKDFQTCALLYDYRHGDPKTRPVELMDQRDRRTMRFEDTIKRVAAFFFYKKQAQTEPSYQALQNRWTKLWFAEGTTAADIAAMKNETLWHSDTSYTVLAGTSLLRFHEEFANKPDYQVVLVDEKFSVPWNREVALEGTFDLVLRHKGPNDQWYYDVYKWTINDLKKNVSKYTFDMVALDYAFRYRNDNKPMNIRYHLWSFAEYDQYRREIEVEKDDKSLLDYWVNALNQTEVFVPRRGLTWYCKSCGFDKPCSKWKPPVKVEVNGRKA